MDMPVAIPSREQLLFALYEAAELEHNLMCTYLYAAFSLRAEAADDLSPKETAAIGEWRRAILGVALDEMGHLTAVWNITAALGGSPRFGRGNFPLDPGGLPANVVVKLAPFNEEVLQHFIYLERPHGSEERDGLGFEPVVQFKRGVGASRLTPMGIDYATVGEFYNALDANLRIFVEHLGEDIAFCGDPALQLSPAEVSLLGAQPVICLKTASAAFKAIVEQGEGAPANSAGSHFQRFLGIRAELRQLKAENPLFAPAYPAAWNPLLRRPVRAEGRIWIEDEEAASTVDLANAAYALMLRLLAYSYAVPRPQPDKALAIDLASGTMRAMTHLAERAVRLPAGPANPDCNAGMSFTAIRDTAPLLPGSSTRRFFVERFAQLVSAAETAAQTGDPRLVSAARLLGDLSRRAERGFSLDTPGPDPLTSTVPSPVVENGGQKQARVSPDPQLAPGGTPPTPTVIAGVDHIDGRDLTLLYDGPKCIHARFCVTGAPGVFLANVKGPWINPDATDVDRLVEIAHACPSGAIRYRRKDGKPDEAPPPVNLIAIREGGPYAVRADIRLDGQSINYRATLCRCGASKHKPYCDGSHHDIEFAASGEPPPTGDAEMLPVRDGPLAIDPEIDGPLRVRGNLEITSGTGRVVARVAQTRLCRCGGSATKPFCDGSHAVIRFRS